MAGKAATILSQVVIDGQSEWASELCLGAVEIFKWNIWSGSKGNEVGLYVFGTEEKRNMLEEFGFEHVYQVGALRPASFEVMRRLLRHDVPSAKCAPERMGMSDAMYAAREELNERSSRKDSCRRMFLFTDASCAIDKGEELKKLIHHLKSECIEWTSFVLGRLEEDAKLRKALRAAAKWTGGECFVLEPSESGWGLVREVRLHLCRCAEAMVPRSQNLELQLGPLVSIACKKVTLLGRESLPRAAEESIPGMERYNQGVLEDAAKPGQVTSESRFEIARKQPGDDEELEEMTGEEPEEQYIESSDCTRAYKFGSQMVPVDEATEREALAELDNEPRIPPRPGSGAFATIIRCAPLRGLTEPENVLGKPTILVRGKGERDAAALGALARALRFKKMCAVARWQTSVKQPNVSLVALCPRLGRDDFLVVVQLPFADDRVASSDPSAVGLFVGSAKADARCRQFKHVEEEHVLAKAAEGLVDARRLSKRRPFTMANPVRQRFIDLIIRRAIPIGEEPDSVGGDYVPDAQRYLSDAQDALRIAFGRVCSAEADSNWSDALAKLFEANDVRDKKMTQRMTPKRWRDHVFEAKQSSRSTPREAPVSPSESVFISSTEPVAQFRSYFCRALQTSHAELADLARTKMRDRIIDLVNDAEENEDPELYEKAASCIGALRDASDLATAAPANAAMFTASVQHAFNEFIDTFVNPKRAALSDLDEALGERAPGPLRLGYADGTKTAGNAAASVRELNVSCA